MRSRPRLVWCSGASWDGVAGTDRHMATELSRHADVLWVDPPVSPVAALRSRGKIPLRLWPELTRMHEQMERLTPVALPLHTRGPMRKLTARLNRLQLSWALKRLGDKPDVVVVSHLEDLLSGWGRGTLRVLYGTDDYVAGAELMRIDVERVKGEERLQLSNADVAVVISEQLAERWRSLGFERPITLVPNGVDSEAYRDLHRVEVAPEAKLPAPVAGLVGQLSARIDIGLLESVVDAGCSLLMVGPLDSTWQQERFRKLCSRPNVRWVGAVPFRELPGFFKAIDVGLTPYVDSSFNRASFPLKTLEYLAAGKPVVSTDLPSARWLGTDLVTLAEGDGYGKAVRLAATTSSSADLIRRRIEFAAKHSWQQRAASFLAAIGLPCAEDPEEKVGA